MLPNGLVRLLAASFQSLPVGSSPGNSEFPPSQLGCRWRSYVPSKCTLDPGDRVGAARGEGGRFAHSLHTAARLPGQRCLLSEAEPPSMLPSPRFQLGWGLPALRVEGQQQNTHTGPSLGVHIIGGGQQPGSQLPHSPRFSFGSSDSWSKCVFLSLMMRASASRTTESLREVTRTNVFPVLWVPVCGGPQRFLSLPLSYIHLPS